MSAFESGAFSDVTIVLPEARVAAHKLILASQSEFFKRLFESHAFQESSSNEVKFGFEDTAAVLPEVLRAFYVGSLTINRDNAIDMLMISKQLLCPHIQDAVERYLKECTDPFHFLLAAQERDVDDSVISICAKKLALSFDTVSRRQSLSCLSFPCMLHLLKREDLHVSEEVSAAFVQCGG